MFYELWAPCTHLDTAFQTNAECIVRIRIITKCTSSCFPWNQNGLLLLYACCTYSLWLIVIFCKSSSLITIMAAAMCCLQRNKGHLEYVITLTAIACLFIVAKFDLLAYKKFRGLNSDTRQFAIIYALIDYSVEKAWTMFCNHSLFWLSVLNLKARLFQYEGYRSK